MEIVDIGDFNPQPGHLKSEDMASGFPVCRDKMEMVSWDIDPLDVIGTPESDYRPFNFPQLKERLVLDDVDQPRIGFILPRDTPGFHIAENPVQSNGIKRCS